ncbi:MAG: BatA domain-containing protein [Gemmatimonadota bacterium]
MRIAFLAPLFAGALAAIVVPLLVHLVHKERKEAIRFPSLMFVQRTPYQHSSRQRIRDWLLFAARCLVIALLAAAFMRPVLARTAEASAESGGGTEVVVMLDRSLSMRHGERWAMAQRAVRERIGALGNDDRLTLVPFDTRASAVNQATADGATLRAALDSIAPSDAGTKLAPAVALARRLLGGSRLPRKEVVIVSDFQRTAWDLDDDVKMPAGTTIVPVDVGQGTVINRSVRSVEMRRDAGGGNDRVIVSARVVNVGPAAKGVAVRLEVNGRSVDSRRVDLPADGGGSVAFAPVAVAGDGGPARVVLDADAFTADDAYHFALRRSLSLGVLLVEHAEAAAERGVFVTRALAIGDQPAFDVKVVRASRATPGDLAGRRLVVLNDAGLPAGIGAERLTAFVRDGGGVLNALGERSGGRGWPAAGNGLLPGSVASPVDRLGGRGAVLGFLDRTHPALSLFGGPRSGDLSAARFFRYRPLQVEEGVLARFDDGGVALAEHRVGRGRVLTWASSFDGVWNDLPRQAVFLPFVHQLAQYAASYRATRSAHAVGESVNLSEVASSDTATAAQRFSVRAPDGRLLAVGGPDAPPALELRQAGWYEVRSAGVPNERPRLLAANPAPAELDMATFDPARLTNALAPEGDGATSVVTVDPVQRLADQEREQSVWWYILVVAALVLLAEGVLASRVTQRRLQPR